MLMGRTFLWLKISIKLHQSKVNVLSDHQDRVACAGCETFVSVEFEEKELESKSKFNP